MTVVPTLPHARTFIPAAFSMWATISTVVVFPLVPVRASHFCPGTFSLFTDHAKSISLRISSEASRAATTTG